MCPDRQLLSVYCDGELPFPWKEKMESHLSQCSDCRKRLETYRALSLSTASPSMANAASMPPETAVLAAKERVWRKLEPAANTPAPQIRESAFWQRRISIPFPAAAAAAAIIIVAAAALWLRRPPQPAAIPNMILASESELDMPGIIPVSDLNSVLQYLGGRDSGDILILSLPESRNFMSSGEPAIIKAADYSRNTPVRRRP